MPLTFKQLQDEVLAWLDESGETGQILTVVKGCLNEANALRASSGKWPFLVSFSSFTTVPGQRDYALAETFSRPIYFKNTTRNVYLREVPLRHIEESGIDWTDSTSDAFTMRRNTITLLYTPTAAETIEYAFYRGPTEMVNDSDLPSLPYPHSRLLVWDALITLGAYNEDMSGTKLKIFADRQGAAEMALNLAFQERQTVNAHPRRVIDRE